jgi:hypothetical protein
MVEAIHLHPGISPLSAGCNGGERKRRAMLAPIVGLDALEYLCVPVLSTDEYRRPGKFQELT